MNGILFGIDPNETTELDLCLEAGKLKVQSWERAVEGLKAEAAEATEDRKATAAAELAAAERALAAARADVTAYVPGSGPVFVLGHLPPTRAAEADALAGEVFAVADRRQRVVLDLEWQKLVVRYAVRSHRGFRTRGGTELPFQAAAPETLDGKARAVVSDETLELYATSRILRELAMLANRRVRLDDAGKNA
jgi:hypothetical protein